MWRAGFSVVADATSAVRSSRIVVCFVLLTVTVACTKQPPERDRAPERPPGFVTREGTRLVLDGRPFRFHGLNYYDINAFAQENPLNPGTRPFHGCRTHSVVPRVDESLARMGSAANVLRAGFKQGYATAVPLGGGPPKRDWSTFDRTLEAVKRAGMRIIVYPVDHLGSCDVPLHVHKTISWYRSGYRTEVPPGLLSSYQEWVRELVTRYRNRTEILAWQLVNEPAVVAADGSCDETKAVRVLRKFVDDVGGMIKRIDPNHLVTLGAGRVGCGLEGPDRAHYQQVFASPSIDLCEYHDYNEPTNPMPDILRLELDICGRVLKKPLFVGEVGISLSDVLGACPDKARFRACRSRLMAAKFEAQLNAASRSSAEDVVGVLVWTWCDPVWTNCQTYRHDIVVGDPVLKVLASLPTS